MKLHTHTHAHTQNEIEREREQCSLCMRQEGKKKEIKREQC